MSVTIYHNPRCSKSRQTMALLDDLVAQNKLPDLKVEVIEYLKAPLSVEQLTDLMTHLGYTDARDMMRSNEAAYKEFGLGESSVSTDRLLEAIVDNPILLQRPIVVHKNKAKIGRPPEDVLSLF